MSAKGGKLVLHTISNEMNSVEEAEKWVNILNQITFEEMSPQNEQKRPSVAKSTDVIEWINKRLTGSGKAGVGWGEVEG